MNSGTEAMPAYGRPGRSGTPSESVLASALLELHALVPASTYAAYVPVAGRAALGAAVAVDTPCSFTVPTDLPLSDLQLPTARAYRTGELIVAEAPEVQELTRQVPARFLHTPFPMAVASVPLADAGQIFGCLSVRWSRTQTPEATISRDDLRHLRGVSRRLAGELARLARTGASLEAPAIPVFVPSAPQELSPTGLRSPAEQLGWGITSTASLYQLKRLSMELAAAVRLRDVLAAAQNKIMPLFDATGLMLCRTRDGRLRVVGCAGFPRDEIARVDGTPLSLSTPETDTVTRVEARPAQPRAAMHEGATPATIGATERPRAYMPLIASGQAIGCCVLEFPARPRRFPADEEIALAALMLGQIGQALERVQAHEAEHTFARTMQQSLLPTRLPFTPETLVTCRYLPATDGIAVGGDWYDVIPLPDGTIGFAVGDVEGHHAEAAGVMAHLRSAVLAYATEGHGPATVLERLDGLLRVLGISRYATCCCLWLDPATGVAQVATAGHPLPLISPAPSRLTTLDVPVGPPLGLGDGHHYEQREITLEPDSVTALYTDGLLDTRTLGPDGARSRLAGKLTHGDRDNMHTLADELISERRSQTTLDDDAALLLMRYDGRRHAEQQDVSRLFIQRYDLQAVASVRHHLSGLLPRWKTEALLDDLQLILSEVVTNALIHAQSDVDIRLRRHTAGVRVEVQDNSALPPVPTVIVADEAVNAEAESGRGLLIVDALATAWGSSPAGRGKTTWIEMTLPDGDS
ncbi:SpoIIE family protein phosphatase [Streptomyces rubrogriseus]|uniref:ATP-binding SpoIIE family protein phosphatase n=1 Tax=Streptomyces rubrogriseus TaxID=194673 RepID=UPI0036FD2C43